MDTVDPPSGPRPEPRVEGRRHNLVEMLTVGLIAFVIWTEMDIVGAPLYPERAAYNDVWYLALFGFLLLLGIAYRTVALPFGLWLLSAIGGEDALYFYLRLRPVPARLPWLDGHLFIWQPPTNVTITSGLVAGLAALVGLVLLERTALTRWRQGKWKGLGERRAESPSVPDAEVAREAHRSGT